MLRKLGISQAMLSVRRPAYPTHHRVYTVRSRTISSPSGTAQWRHLSATDIIRQAAILQQTQKESRLGDKNIMPLMAAENNPIIMNSPMFSAICSFLPDRVGSFLPLHARKRVRRMEGWGRPSLK